MSDTPNSWQRWIPAEDQFLRSNYGVVPTNVLAVKLGRSIGAVRSHAASQGVPAGRAWAERDLEFLRSHYKCMPATEIARRLDRSPPAVIAMARRHCLGEARPHWTQGEIATLRGLYPMLGLKIAGHLPDKSLQSIRQKAYRLRIKAPGRQEPRRVTEAA